MAPVNVLFEVLHIVDKLEQDAVAEDHFCLILMEPARKKSIHKDGGPPFLNSQGQEGVLGSASAGSTEPGGFLLRMMDGKEALVHVRTARPRMFLADHPEQQCKGRLPRIVGWREAARELLRKPPKERLLSPVGLFLSIEAIVRVGIEQTVRERGRGQ